MATAYGNKVGHWRAYVKAWVTSEDDNYATIKCESYFNSIGWGFDTGAQGAASVNGQSTGWSDRKTAHSPKGGSVKQLFASKSLRVKKQEKASSISCVGSIKLVGGYENGTSTATIKVSVAARKKHPPSAPSTPKVERVISGSSAAVKLTWSTKASNATGTRISRETYGSGSETIRTGGVISSFTDAAPAGGTYRYKVQNYNADGNSSWSKASEWIQPLAAPSAPTLLAPANGEMLDSASDFVELKWQHNPVDGSAQTQAELQWKSDASWQTVSLTNEQSYMLPTTSIQNSDIEWKVKTKGLFESFSPYSETRMFRLRTSPSVDVAPVGEVTGYPAYIGWTYDDASGEQDSVVVSLSVDDRVVWSKQIDGAATSYELQPTDYRLQNNEVYLVKVTATSTTGLQGVSSDEFTTNITPPAAPSIVASFDRETLSTDFVVESDPSAGEIEYSYVLRNGVVIASDIDDGVTIVDILPPIDVDVEYTAVSVGIAGSIASTSIVVRTTSDPCIAINFGDGYKRLNKLIGNISTSAVRKMEKSSFNAANSRLPISTFGTHETHSGSFSGIVFADGRHGASIADFEDLSQYTGKCILRLPWGERHVVTLDADVRRDNLDHAEVSVSWEEIDDDSLL